MRPRLLCLIILATLALSSKAYSPNVEVDALAYVVRVVDGDTVLVEVVEVRSDKLRGTLGLGERRVRLADVNAPELSTPEGARAKDALSGILRVGEQVYLDVDDLYIFDKYGRIVAVVYVRFNGTHALNVNAWLLKNGYAELRDYDNEFNPNSWTLYARLNVVNAPQFTVPFYAVAIVVGAVVLAVLIARSLRGRTSV